ncbi:MAG: hypothetical protein BEN19_05140 [Epulopiscium sp. Nuni2H_MBin003]|nr:MAG: hypothetical protein BEN19_05140 [Epulopiscium sp. Nuni2H_MBin003]
MFKKILALGFSVMTIASIQPVFATEVQQPSMSSWATEDIFEGSKYGIFPMEWCNEVLTQEVTSEQISTIINMIEEKFMVLDLVPVEDYKTDNTNLTRKGILHKLYQTIDQYEGKYGDSVEYFVQNGLLVGDEDSNLRLNDVATTEETIILATRFVEHVFDVYDKSAKGIAWEVTNGENTIYLYGVAHTGISDMYPINPDVLDAYNSADYLLVEINHFLPLSEEDKVDIFLPEGTVIQDILSEEVYEKLALVCDMQELPVDNLDNFMPWTIKNEFQRIYARLNPVDESIEQATFDYGVDRYFLTKAMMSDKPVIELESNSDYHETYYNHEYQESQIDLVLDMILNPNDYDNSNEDFLQCLQYYIDGDIENFTKLTATLDSEMSMEILYGKRDEKMASQMIDFLEQEGENTYFAAIGAGHYVIDGTIIDILEDKGYTVTEFYR